MSRQPEKGKSAIQMCCDIAYKKQHPIVIYVVDDFYAIEINDGRIFDRDVATGATPELAASALLSKLKPRETTEKKKITRGGL